MAGIAGYVRAGAGVRQPPARGHTAPPRVAGRLVALALLVAPAARAQEPPCEPPAGSAQVAGFVSDSATGIALPGARVFAAWVAGSPTGFAAEGDSTGLLAETDAEGRYRLCAVPTGQAVHFTSTFPGRRAEASLTLPEDRPSVRVDFELGAAEAAIGDAVPVEPIHARAPGEAAEAQRASGDVRRLVTREELAERPAAPLFDIVRDRVPGLRLRYDRWGCPSFVTRGGAMQIAIDGSLVESGGCILQSLTTDDIESVEVYSALAASMRFGSITGGGVIEITTRRR